MLGASATIPLTTITVQTAPITTSSSMTRIAPMPRGRPALFIFETSGDPTAPTIEATITGTTITSVSDASQTRASKRIAIPTRNHELRPRLRSQSGAANMNSG